ncbi:hypothetical protein SAMN04487866_12226 [Thermoactinomyces sp. DSM 45891]|nr:hypothetical protein [Thermoactinomyces sp. DSM 45891]SFX74970.1 hypothetical protein SAMN04487866_12226 [Thermoactinomyces sp. DSM 45891]
MIIKAREWLMKSDEEKLQFVQDLAHQTKCKNVLRFIKIQRVS